MLQRVQTLYLIGVIVVQIIMFFVPLAEFLSDMSYFKFYLTGLENMTSGNSDTANIMVALPVAIVNTVIIAFAFFSIAKFKNRMLQVKLNRLNILLIIILTVGILFGYPQWMEKESGTKVIYEAGAYLPLISIVLLFVANIYIIKDEKLVRSADRLR